MDRPVVLWPLGLPELSSGSPSRTEPSAQEQAAPEGPYLVVALGVQAVVVLAVLVGAVDVAAVLAAREPAGEGSAQTSPGQSQGTCPKHPGGVYACAAERCPGPVWGCGGQRGSAGVKWWRPEEARTSD